MLSVLDLFRVGIGPSSSHTVGPMRIARRFLAQMDADTRGQITEVFVELQGSLALTGEGHGTVTATALGLLGHDPETYDPEAGEAGLKRIEDEGKLCLFGEHDVTFTFKRNIDLAGHVLPDLHPNGMKIRALDKSGAPLREGQFYSTGGGFIASEAQLLKPAEDDIIPTRIDVPHPFTSGAELLEVCRERQKSITEIILLNEDAHRPRNETEAKLDGIIEVMFACIDRGLATRGELPGGLKVRRRAPELHAKVVGTPLANEPERLFDILNLYAMAVNEENAAGGKVVTAPTNGAAGIIPSVLRKYCPLDEASDAARRTFLLTAGGIGLLYKQRASISGAEMGCQGEVGVACSMAAAGLAAVWGGTPQQCTNAAEIGMEHNLGLTCDPVGGLVQIPCIERNAIGAVKAVNAARLALQSDMPGRVSLDQVIETMRQTGLDMSNKYKETSQGGLAVNVIEC
ncbi:L-serine ammonia-lyase [Parvularcula sp. ZS-1/3]|uniref:L-serine dehydratase n=1 Tax=Parvularcula mediterranea TaxID=2732508 RepID=A0A7Y3RLT9_9PROT|nr:L-serine ammonia-lyase [Parvularcula mediterranea]NNU16457.1 L-serine ammonia-lyase [Parvularcula mediterranea]